MESKFQGIISIDSSLKIRSLNVVSFIPYFKQFLTFSSPQMILCIFLEQQ